MQVAVAVLQFYAHIIRKGGLVHMLSLVLVLS